MKTSYTLIDNDKYTGLVKEFRIEMHNWAVKYRSTDFLHEAEYMNRSTETTPYEFARSQDYPIEKLISAAEKVGRGTLEDFKTLMKDEYPGVRYWGIIGIQAMPKEKIKEAKEYLIEILNDESPANQITAAKTLCDIGIFDETLPILSKNLKDNRLWVKLYAARSIELIGKDAQPIVPDMLEAWESIKKKPGESSNHRIYKDSNLAAFTGWSLEMALKNCEIDIEITF